MEVQLDSSPITLNILTPDLIIDNSWTVEKATTLRPPATWEKVFENSVHELKDISDILENDKKVNGRYYPNVNNLFEAFKNTSLNNVKVVIFGQDPYHSTNPDGSPQAQGMSFSVKRGASIPPSLKNIYKELKTSIDGFIPPTHGDLLGWARQGVLLLNACLTVRPREPGCHKELWLGFIKRVIDAILDVNPNVIWVCWGRKSANLKKIIRNRGNLLEAPHPSPLSSYRGFFGCNHFNLINEILIKNRQYPINWQV